jgi:DNA-directed RNA polymerase subunit RPC12/RpoP
VVAKLVANDYRARQLNVGGGFVNVYDDVHAYRSFPIPDPDSLRRASFLDDQVKLLSDSAETLKRRSVHFDFVALLLEVLGDVCNQLGLRLRLLCFAVRGCFPSCTSVI